MPKHGYSNPADPNEVKAKFVTSFKIRELNLSGKNFTFFTDKTSSNLL